MRPREAQRRWTLLADVLPYMASGPGWVSEGEQRRAADGTGGAARERTWWLLGARTYARWRDGVAWPAEPGAPVRAVVSRGEWVASVLRLVVCRECSRRVAGLLTRCVPCGVQSPQRGESPMG